LPPLAIFTLFFKGKLLFSLFFYHFGEETKKLFFYSFSRITGFQIGFQNQKGNEDEQNKKAKRRRGGISSSGREVGRQNLPGRG
jgi:hypothetical protein